jgi:hypothetical protein
MYDRYRVQSKDASVTVTDDGSVVDLSVPTGVSAVLDTDGTLAADSDVRIASQKAVKTYVDAAEAAAIAAAEAASVPNTGNSTIAGVKTFSSMPSIPTNTPESASATGITGQICWDATNLYVCVATDTWVKATLATWS